MNYQSFEKQALIDWAISIVKDKAKLDISRDKLFEVIKHEPLKNKLLLNDIDSVTVDEIEYEEFSRIILSSVGYVSEKNNSGLIFSSLYEKYNFFDPKLKSIIEEFSLFLSDEIKQSKVVRLDIFIEQCIGKYDIKYLGFVSDMISSFFEHLFSSPFYKASKYNGIESISLDDLYDKEEKNSVIGDFFDQRYIDYLYKNIDDIQSIHWRKFEELTAQFFKNDGYSVKIGPGRNDDGVDIIASKNKKIIIIQCKRWKSKIDSTIVKALNEDVKYSQSNKGVIVCLKGVSNDSKNIIKNRGYKIEVIDQNMIMDYLRKYKSTL
ncbi:MAG: restriction endonuclease [Erysipelotrichales bacterium]|nr:restriction endonuclease [Erysipelotrichales bacterium]